MPPHCDSMDGPVVKAALAAVSAQDVDLVLPYVKAESEAELRAAFEVAMRAWQQGEAACEVAERYLFDTAVRLHRAGEGAPFTGVKPAGLDVGPVIPVAERGIDSGSSEALEAVLVEDVRHQLHHRFQEMQHAKPPPGAGVPAHRAYVEAMLGLQVWAHGVHLAAMAAGHGEGGEAGHAH